MKMPLRRRRFTLCADDFGQSGPINAAIIELVRVWRIGATSVMSQGPAWPEGARALRDYHHLTDVGLHLNLTRRFEALDSTRPLIWWLYAAPRGKVDREQVRAAFLSQIDLFVKYFGRLPDYLDGHQHVHSFTDIREVLTEVIAECWKDRPRPWVRAPDCVLDSCGVPLKGWVLRRASRGFSEHAAREGLRYTKKLAGLYALDPAADYPRLMKRWLHRLPSGTVLMCHPGHQTYDLSDSIREARYAEYLYLNYRGLSDDCLSADVSLVKFADLEATSPQADSRFLRY